MIAMRVDVLEIRDGKPVATLQGRYLDEVFQFFGLDGAEFEAKYDAAMAELKATGEHVLTLPEPASPPIHLRRV